MNMKNYFFAYAIIIMMCAFTVLLMYVTQERHVHLATADHAYHDTLHYAYNLSNDSSGSNV